MSEFEYDVISVLFLLLALLPACALLEVLDTVEKGLERFGVFFDASQIVQLLQCVLRCLVAGHFAPKVAKQLKLIAVEDDTTVQALLEEALDLLFAKKGRARIAELLKS